MVLWQKMGLKSFGLIGFMCLRNHHKCSGIYGFTSFNRLPGSKKDFTAFTTSFPTLFQALRKCVVPIWAWCSGALFLFNKNRTALISSSRHLFSRSYNQKMKYLFWICVEDLSLFLWFHKPRDHFRVFNITHFLICYMSRRSFSYFLVL